MLVLLDGLDGRGMGDGGWGIFEDIGGGDGVTPRVVVFVGFFEEGGCVEDMIRVR